MARLSDYTKTSYSPEEIFGQYCHTAEYIRCPVDMAFEYASNVYSLEEFTFRVRDFHYVGGGLYKGIHVLAKDTSIYMHVDAYPDSRVVDHVCAWDQGDELWMRYHFRFLDAMPRAGNDRVLVQRQASVSRTQSERCSVQHLGTTSADRPRLGRRCVAELLRDT